MKLPRKKPAGKVSDDRRLDRAGIDSRIGDGRGSRLDDGITNCFPLLPEVPQEIGAGRTHDKDRFTHGGIDSTKRKLQSTQPSTTTWIAYTVVAKRAGGAAAF